MPIAVIVVSIIVSLLIGGETVNYILTSQPALTVSSSTLKINNKTVTPEIDQYPAPTIDPDPIIDCTTKSLGVIRKRRSECLASVDCLINGKYLLANNNDECNGWVKQAQTPQKAYQQPTYQYNQSQYAYPTTQLSAPPTTTPVNNSSNDCMNAVKSKRDVCNQSCYAQRDTSGNQEYTGGTSPYLQCLDNCLTNNPYNCN